MSRYFKIGKMTDVPFPCNVPIEITQDDFLKECREMDKKAKKKNLHFASWMIPGSSVRIYGLVETNTIYGFNMD